MKQLKPGQLCTIKNIHGARFIFRCKKVQGYKCTNCALTNRKYCILHYYGILPDTGLRCNKIFKRNLYPVLVK